jgi:hypothetical protein
MAPLFDAAFCSSTTTRSTAGRIGSRPRDLGTTLLQVAGHPGVEYGGAAVRLQMAVEMVAYFAALTPLDDAQGETVGVALPPGCFAWPLTSHVSACCTSTCYGMMQLLVHLQGLLPPLILFINIDTRPGATPSPPLNHHLLLLMLLQQQDPWTMCCRRMCTSTCCMASWPWVNRTWPGQWQGQPTGEAPAAVGKECIMDYQL